MSVFMSQWSCGVNGHVSQWSCGVSGHVESYGVKGVTDLQALILWRTGHLAFNNAAVPQCSVTPLPG